MSRTISREGSIPAWGSGAPFQERGVSPARVLDFLPLLFLSLLGYEMRMWTSGYHYIACKPESLKHCGLASYPTFYPSVCPPLQGNPVGKIQRRGCSYLAVELSGIKQSFNISEP